jgi:hypothetical protein
MLRGWCSILGWLVLGTSLMVGCCSVLCTVTVATPRLSVGLEGGRLYVAVGHVNTPGVLVSQPSSWRWKPLLKRSQYLDEFSPMCAIPVHWGVVIGGILVFLGRKLGA